MKSTRLSGMAAAVSLALSLVAFTQTSTAGEASRGPEKEGEGMRGITVLLPDGSPAPSKKITLIVDANREVGEMEKLRPYATFSPSVSRNMLLVVGITRKVGEMERMGPYGPLSSDENGFLPLPEEVVRLAGASRSFTNVLNFFPRLIVYDKPSDAIVLKGGGYFTSKDIFFGRPKSIRLREGTLDEGEKGEFFAGRGKQPGRGSGSEKPW